MSNRNRRRYKSKQKHQKHQNHANSLAALHNADNSKTRDSSRFDVNLSTTSLAEMDNDLRAKLVNLVKYHIDQDKLLISPGEFLVEGSQDIINFQSAMLIRKKSRDNQDESFALEVFQDEQLNPPLAYFVSGEISSKIFSVCKTLNLVGNKLVETKNKPRIIKFNANNNYYPFVRGNGGQFLTTSENEYRIASQLPHMHIKPPVIIATEKGNKYSAIVMKRFLSMDFLQYYNSEMDNKDSPLSCGNVHYLRDLSLRIINAYSIPFAAGIVHASLKFENFIIDPENLDIVLVDYGSSRLEYETGTRAGGRFFAAPEVLPGRKGFNNFASDIYSLGKILEKIWESQHSTSLLCEKPKIIDDMINVDPGLRPEFYDVKSEFETLCGNRDSKVSCNLC